MGLTPRELGKLEDGTREKLRGRAAGAVTLAVGMAKVFASLPGLKTLMSYWYHFIIMFEALFILTLLEAGTRVARFIVQETIVYFKPSLAPSGRAKWTLNILISAITCYCWGYLLYRGNLDTLWRMFGIANQLLAAIALTLGTMFILQQSPKKIYALCTAIPLFYTIITVATAGVESIGMWWRQIPSAPVDQILQIKLMCVLAGIMMGLTALVTIDAHDAGIGLYSHRSPSRLPCPYPSWKRREKIDAFFS